MATREDGGRTTSGPLRHGRRSGRRPGARRALGAALVVAVASAAGCVALHKGGLFPADRDQVFLMMFRNDTFYRDVQFLLTEGVKDEILSRPGLHLTSKDEAEIILSGRVVNVRQRVLSEDPERITTSQSTTITVMIEVTDARTGQVLKTKRLSRRGEYVPGRGEGLGDARVEAFRFLARDIVRELEADF